MSLQHNAVVYAIAVIPLCIKCIFNDITDNHVALLDCSCSSNFGLPSMAVVIPSRIANTTPKVSLTVTRVRCILGIKNDGNIDGMIITQGRKQRLPIESPVAD